MNYGISKDKAEDIAEKGFQCADFISKFMANRWENSLCHIEPQNLREKILIGLWQRAFCWLKTLAKLNQTSDYQTVATASRALIEIYIDIVLIIYDNSNEKSDELYWWYQSERLKAFELEVKFQQKNNLQIDTSIQYFIDNNKTEIETHRLRIWGMSKHPNFKRWTGKTLESDAKEIDTICLSETRNYLGFSLQEYFETQYRRVHWDIHSGITSVYGYEPQKFSLNNFSYVWNSSNLGIICTKLILTEFGYSQVLDNFEEEFTKLQIEQNKYLPMP